jgi:hypothetical protein
LLAFRRPVELQVNMRQTARAALRAAIAIAIFGSSPASAQPSQPHPLDRVVQVRTVEVGGGQAMFGSVFAALRPLSVPFGFEEAGALAEYTVATGRWPRPSKSMKVGGLTVRAALDAIVAADPRYEWRYVDGVVVMRPVASAGDSTHPLLRVLPPVYLERVTGGQAIDAVNEATGHAVEPVISFPSTHAFSVAFTGGPLVDLLNAIVAAHGEMGWSLHGTGSRLADGQHMTVRPLLFIHSPLGGGIGVNGALLEPTMPVPFTVRREGDPGRSETPARDRLDRLLPPTATRMHAKGMTRLAASLGVPAGFEEVDALREHVSKPFPLPDGGIETIPPQEFTVPVAGLTLRQALDAYVAADRRYEWRDMDGVVVMRPVASWARADHPLAAPASAVRLRDARISEAFDALLHAVESAKRPPTLPFGDEQRISVDFAGGDILHLVNAIVRGYGRLSWSLVSNEGLFGLDRATAVWVVEPVLTLEAQHGGSGIPLSRPSQP